MTRRLVGPAAAVVLLLGLTAGSASPYRHTLTPVTAPTPAVAPVPQVPAALPAPAGLPVISYTSGPSGLPADPAPMSTDPLSEGVRPTADLVVYDAPGGQPRAVLPSRISGVPVTVPIVERRPGWVAVLMPSANRTIGWVTWPDWIAVPLPDQLVLRLATRELAWYRGGVRQQAWTVAIGSPQTPTPLGRTFVLGRTRPPGAVYGGIDVIALGAIPDSTESLPAGLFGAHIGIHSWYRDDVSAATSPTAASGCRSRARRCWWTWCRAPR